MNDIKKLGKYHIVLNPDIEYEVNQLELMYSYMEDNLDIGFTYA